jgi:hypothetical protein
MTAEAARPPRWWTIGAWLAIAWNAIGIVTFILDALKGDDMPAWVLAAYGVAVLAGTAGSLGLLLRRRWAMPLLILSLAAICVQMGQAIFLSDMVARLGAQSVVMPLLITAIAVALVWLARLGTRHGWLR